MFKIKSILLFLLLVSPSFAKYEESIGIIEVGETDRILQHGIIVEKTDNIISVVTVSHIFRDIKNLDCRISFPKYNIYLTGKRIKIDKNLALCVFSNNNYTDLKPVKFAENNDGDIFAFKFKNIKNEEADITVVPCKYSDNSKSEYDNFFVQETLILGGGILFNLKDEVVGIVKFEYNKDLSYPIVDSVPVNNIQRFIKKEKY